MFIFVLIMNSDEIIELGITLGLPFNIADNFYEKIENNYVVFNGCNGQRFSFDGNKLSDNEILKEMGKALIYYGMRLKAIDINNVLSIGRDSTELPIHLQND